MRMEVGADNVGQGAERGARVLESEAKQLRLYFHGRIIASLGIQMYQSPVAAIAELIANSWDADATEVKINLPDDLGDVAEIIVSDDGIGMSFAECQSHYLNVGRDRRVDEGRSTTRGGRPCLGRKGIGKFAGFGIAQLVEVDTTSKETGECTVFRMDLNSLRSSTFVSTEGTDIEILEATDPDTAARERHGTTIRLKALTLSQRRTPEALARQMARRFLLAQQAAEFRVTINGKELPRDEDFGDVQFDFPLDYEEAEKPKGLAIAGGWGTETLSDGNEIRWRMRFAHFPIGVDEFRGVSVFCGIKLAQAPFFFQLSGGLSGQHGEQYVSGTVTADYLDRGPRDVITTERKRINWEDKSALPLLLWGQERLKDLLAIWKARRARDKVSKIEGRVAGFSKRLARLQPSEAKTVKRALTRIASIEAIDDPQFEDLAGAVLTAWENGKLRELVRELAETEAMDANRLVSLLLEEQVLSALQVLEITRAKIDVLRGLRERIANRELELAVRDFIAKHPWLISPQWETFAIEENINHILEIAAAGALLRVPVDRDHRFRWKMITQSGGT